MGAPQQALLMVNVSPSSIAGLVGWYDFSDTSTITTSSGRVTICTNKAGSSGGGGRLEVDTGPGPTYSSATQNGLNTALFDGSTTYLDDKTVDALLRNVSGWSKFIVCKTLRNNNSVVDTIANVASADAITARAAIQIQPTTGNWSAGGRRLQTDAFQNCISSTQATITAFHYLSVVASYTATTCTLFLDGTQIAQNIAWASVGTTSNDGGFLWMGRSGAGTSWFNGHAGELLIYDNALSTTSRQTIEGYLKSKWGIP